ncbi:hypothetical protein Rsub_05533 [Raphidocelis subcapitata]|uniref:Pherophorin domain-containing protein n=1 Tax=Raphidocelis subcapitata TaxID=307507 RepID=A0A2V0NXH3_9CHLO|nr:hypothetical protein Rsub_05533 [Raphidocelis subcapitata]|eukprot:GBF92331.1 hypothetical protein Rsub_05533 [Raphidocelis subcapitata]
MRRLALIVVLAAALAATAAARPLGIADGGDASADEAPSLLPFDDDPIYAAALPEVANGLMQLDTCNSSPRGPRGPRGNRLPSMSLAMAEGVCNITARVIGGDGSGLELSFPCESSPSARSAPRLSGATLNLWASLGAGAGAGSCTVTTLSPPVQYKLTPRGFFYGYELNKMRCRLTDSSETLAALGSGDGLATSAGRDRASAAQGLWLVPDRPSPVQGGDAAFDTTAQWCRLVVAAGGRAYASKRGFSCSLQEDPEARLGAGRCFGSPAHFSM